MNKHHMYRRVIVFVLAAILLVSSTASVSAIGKGSKGSNVYAVQGMLQTMGYFTGTITGYYGDVTAGAVKRFQAAYGLPITGYVDNKTLQSILWAYGKYMIPPTPTPAPTPAPAPTPTPTPAPAPRTEAPGLSTEEQQMLNLINAERQKAGLAPLQADLALSRVAEVKSQEMVDKNYFSHNSPTYGTPFDMMKSFGITYRTAGENIACNQTVSAAHTALMNSQGHRENILKGAFTHIGIGIVNGGACGKMFTQMFIGK